MLRSFFAHVPSDPPPEVPAVEPPDPNFDRALSASFRAARRNLVAACAISLCWSTAQFGLEDLTLEAAGVTLNLGNASVPLLLGAALLYLTVRWVLEFAMMPRHVRRWRLAQIDFRLVSILARFSILAVAAGALDRSLSSVAAVVVLLGGLAISSLLLSIPLMFFTMFVRMWARDRANSPSAANAASEGLAWAMFFSICLTSIAIVALGIASYRYEPLAILLWPVPPNPLILAVFVIVLIAVFVSRWLLRPVLDQLFSIRPPYRTERGADGKLIYEIVGQEKEPLL